MSFFFLSSVALQVFAVFYLVSKPGLLHWLLFTGHVSKVLEELSLSFWLEGKWDK